MANFYPEIPPIITSIVLIAIIMFSAYKMIISQKHELWQIIVLFFLTIQLIYEVYAGYQLINAKKNADANGVSCPTDISILCGNYVSTIELHSYISIIILLIGTIGYGILYYHLPTTELFPFMDFKVVIPYVLTIGLFIVSLYL